MEIAAFNARNALKSVNRNLEKSPHVKISDRSQD